jgi:hypothetical protein
MNIMNMNRKEVVILLLADMRNSRLILGLQAVGLNTDNFYTNLTDLILQKMGFENVADIRLRVWYEDTMHTLIDRDLNYYIFHEHHLAEHLYDLIEAKKISLDHIPQESVEIAWGGKLKKWFMGK